MSKHRQLRILDVGGGRNSWLEELVTDVIDMRPEVLSESVSVHLGDVHYEATWDFPEKHFDFISCTHTLEDIRDPQRVVALISRYGKAGFIAVPNRHTELSRVESMTWIGNYHHRWIFTVTSDKRFTASARWHYLNPFAQNPILRSAAKLFTFISPKFREAVSNTFPSVEIQGYSRELVADYSKLDFYELGLVWAGDIELDYFNEDWSGASPKESAVNMSKFLSQDFPFEEESLDTELVRLMRSIE